MYGKSLQKNWKQSFSNTQIVENPDMLEHMEDMASKETTKMNVTTNMHYTSTPKRQEPTRTMVRNMNNFWFSLQVDSFKKNFAFFDRSCLWFPSLKILFSD